MEVFAGDIFLLLAAKFAICMILFRSGKEDAEIYSAARGLDDSLLAIMLLLHICCHLLECLLPVFCPVKLRCAGTFSGNPYRTSYDR